MKTERWLTDDEGDVRTDVVMSMMTGEYDRGTVLYYRDLELFPCHDRSTVFAVDRQDGREIGAVNVGAIATGKELVDVLDEYGDTDL